MFSFEECKPHMCTHTIIYAAPGFQLCMTKIYLIQFVAANQVVLILRRDVMLFKRPLALHYFYL